MSGRRSSDSQLTSEISYRRLFETARDGILVLDPGSKMVVEANPYLASVLGRTRDELIGKCLPQLGILTEEETERALSTLTNRADLHFEDLCVRTKTGTEVAVDFVGNLYEVEGRMVVQINIRDISERKRAQQGVQMYIQRLEWSNRELQDFAHIASHDLQEPLRAIQVFADRIAGEHSENLSEVAANYFTRMQDAAWHMQVLIHDLLAYSRVNSKARPFVGVPLSNVLRAVKSDLVSVIGKLDAEIDIGDLPVIQADYAQMRQLFQNLISNSLKFHRKGEIPRIRIYATGECIHPAPASLPPLSGMETSDYLEVIVEDNGIGFEQKYAERIFGPFERLHSRRNFAGSGIGLAICRKIVERHFGSITASSDPNVGTQIHIFVPRNSPSPIP